MSAFNACDCYYDGHFEVVSNTMQKARNPRQCSECNRTIYLGETYRREFGLLDGRHYEHKICTYCDGLANYLAAHIPYFCWTLGSLREDALDILRRYGKDNPGLFFGGARFYVAPERRKKQEKKEG